MLPLIAIAVLVLLAGAIFLYYNRRVRVRAIAEIVAGPDLLATWIYNGIEWQKAVEDEFSWGKAADGSAQIYIAKTGVYLKSDSREHLIELTTRGKVVTYAAYGGPELPLKLRVRWRVVRHRRDGGEEIKYHREDYRIPVPPQQKEAAEKVARFFTAELERNPGFYTLLVGDDEPISLFGRDSF
jgi:hypothetical protein